MNGNLQFTLNGKLQRVSTDPRRTLLEILREDLDLTGTKYGCGEGQCRACTVLLDGSPVRSCLTEVAEVEGRNVDKTAKWTTADHPSSDELFAHLRSHSSSHRSR